MEPSHGAEPSVLQCNIKTQCVRVTSQTEKKRVHVCVCDVRGCNIEQLDSILSTAGGYLV